MPKFACRCGYVMNLSHGTSDCELTLLPERVIDEIGALLNGGDPLTEEMFYSTISEVGITVYRCPMCSRLHLENKAEMNNFTSYIPES